MKDHVTLNCSAKQLKAFFRFEIKFSDLTDQEADHIILKNPARVRYEDIVQALENMHAEKTGIMSVHEEWLEPMLALGDQTGLASLMGAGTMAEADIENGFSSLPLEREDALRFVLCALENQDGLSFNGEDEVQDLSPWLDILKNVQFNEEHPMSCWRLTDVQKIRLIQFVFDHNGIDLLEKDEKELYRKCLEDECAAHVSDALRIKAYCLNGGNSIYDADYEQSADILAELVEEEGDPFDADTLGMIYYEGKHDNGNPDYELAYQCFTIGAFNGIYSSMCMCSDMLIKGQGTPVNLSAASNLVQFAYSHTKEQFTDGEIRGCYAECAYRMGLMQRYGIGEESDAMLSYSYFLEAMTALSLRMQVMHRDGDEKLYRDIERQIREAENVLGEHVRKNASVEQFPFLIDRLLSSGHSVKVKLHRDKDGKSFLHVTRAGKEGGWLLLTCEEMGYCCLRRSFDIEIRDLDEKGTENMERARTIDSVGYDQETMTTVFTHHGRDIAHLKCSAFILKDDRGENWRQEPLVSFAAVVFPGETREYDFLCPLQGLKRGDRLIAETSQGPEEVIFLRKFRARMSEMPLPKDRYRKILQKKDDHLYS